MKLEQTLAIFGGSQVVLVALIAYLGKLWASRIELNYEAILKNKVNANNEQFAKEFEFYQIIWGQMSSLRNSIRMAILDLNDTSKKLVKNEAESLYILVEKNEPFFPQSLVVDLDNMRNLAVNWSEYASGDNQELLKKLNNLDELNKRYMTLCQNIRQRLASLSQLEE